MTQWPPKLKYAERTPRRLHTWRFTRDGPLWGAILLVVTVAAVLGFILSLLRISP